VSENTEGVITLWHQGKSLLYTTITKCQRRTDIFNSKEKAYRVDKIIQERRGKYIPPSNHPWKKAGAAAIAARKNLTLQKGLVSSD
jgi:hypothetical protein